MNLLHIRNNAFGCWYVPRLSAWLLSISCLIFIGVMISFIHLIFKLVEAKEILKQDELDLILEEKTTFVEAEK